jgi:hypothetical protein
VASLREPLGREIGCASELHDALGEPIDMLLIVRGMLVEGCDEGRRRRALRYKIPALVTQY